MNESERVSGRGEGIEAFATGKQRPSDYAGRHYCRSCVKKRGKGQSAFLSTAQQLRIVGPPLRLTYSPNFGSEVRSGLLRVFHHETPAARPIGSGSGTSRFLAVNRSAV